jgi:hypothetical protein
MSIKNIIFESQVIRIELASYEHCTFKNCRIEYGGAGPLQLNGCSFVGCTWVLVEQARNTVEFFKTMQHQMGDFGQAMMKVIIDGIMNPNQPAMKVPMPNSKE